MHLHLGKNSNVSLMCFNVPYTHEHILFLEVQRRRWTCPCTKSKDHYSSSDYPRFECTHMNNIQAILHLQENQIIFTVLRRKNIYSTF